MSNNEDDEILNRAREAIERLSWTFENIMANAELADIVRTQLKPYTPNGKWENFWDAAKREGIETDDALYLLSIYDNRDAVRIWAKEISPLSDKVSAPIWIIVYCPVFTGTRIRKIALLDDRLGSLRSREADALLYHRIRGDVS